MLGSQDLEELILKSFEVGSEELKNLLPGLATKENSFSFLNVFNLEYGKENPNGWWRAQELHKDT